MWKVLVFMVVVYILSLLVYRTPAFRLGERVLVAVLCNGSRDIMCTGGNYCNLSAGAGEVCRLVINERSRWQWAGDGCRQTAGKAAGGGRKREREN